MRVTIGRSVHGLATLIVLLGALSGHSQETPRPASFAGAPLINYRPQFLAGVWLDQPREGYRVGDALHARCCSERNAYLYLLYHQADGSSRLIYPVPGRSSRTVQAKKPIMIPGPGEKYTIRVTPPLGQEVFQVVACTKPIPEFDRLDWSAGRFPDLSAEVLKKLGERLAMVPQEWTEQHLVVRTHPPTRRPLRAGVFIGVGKQNDPHASVSGKTSPEITHSAELMYDLMLRVGGLDPKRTKLIRDAEATHDNLEELIARWLPSVAEPGDTVFIYYSGHGGLTNAPPRQAFLGPYDFDNHSVEGFRRTAIKEDLLARWLQELQDRQVVLILDTCHSGGFVQSKDLARALERQAARVKDISQMNTVILTSCAADEESLVEGSADKVMLFTQFLADGVRSLPRPLTMAAAHKYTADKMKAVLRGKPDIQEPTLTDNALLTVHLVP